VDWFLRRDRVSVGCRERECERERDSLERIRQHRIRVDEDRSLHRAAVRARNARYGKTGWRSAAKNLNFATVNP